ncbi:hypothetical protein ACW2Q0_05235 [Nocardia sp. R16R-3T]
MGFNWWRDAEPEPNTNEPLNSADWVPAQQILERIRSEQQRQKVLAEDARNADAGMWPNGWPHEPPDQPLSVLEAHQTMQRHRGCRTDGCPRKAAAFAVLVESGKVRPDPRRAH